MIFTVPADTPVTTPEVPTVAIAELPLTQDPPVGEDANAVVDPTHTDIVPVITDGAANTESEAVRTHPEAVYEIVAVPAAIPVTIPVEPTTAVPVALLAHVPPPVAEDNVIVAPAHTDVAPVMAAGSALTVTTAVRVQPDTV